MPPSRSLSIAEGQPPATSNQQPPIKILSIDGGGIRGIIPALVLARIEQLTNRPIARLFDLVAGTSTGGILALGLTIPKLHIGSAHIRIPVTLASLMPS